MRRSAGVAGLILAVVLTGCGGEEPGTFRAPSKAPVENATGFLTTVSFVPTMKQAMTGKDTVKVTSTITGGGADMTITGVMSRTKPVAMSVELDSPTLGGKSRMILVDKVFYLSMQDLVAQGKYVKIDSATMPNDPTAKLLAGISENADPATTFDSFEAGMQQTKHVGSETIDGQKTEKYRVTVDYAKAMAGRNKPAVPGIPPTVEFDVWMLPDNLVRRFSMELAGIRTVVDLTDWGKPVSIKAPAPADIVER